MKMMLQIDKREKISSRYHDYEYMYLKHGLKIYAAKLIEL